MTGAMYAAISGLKAHMSALNVIGNNISNVNTTGYKAARYTFNEALYTTSRSGSNGSTQEGGRNPAQIGYGSSIGTIDLDMSTKSYTPTGIMTDCMIDGDGFFILGDKTKASGITTQTELQGMNLSRLGNFQFDAEGWLVDGNGSVVYGFLCTGYNEQSKQYEYSPTLTAIRLPQSTNTEVDIVDDDGNVAGTRIQTNIYYPRVSGGSTLDGDKPVFATTGDPPVVDKETIASVPGKPEYTATLLATLKTDYTAVKEYLTTHTGTTPTAAQMANYNEYKGLLAQADADAAPVSLSSISIDSTGRITGISQDNQLVCIGFVGLAKVDNPNGVTHTDGRYFQALGGAGNVHLCSIGGNIAYVPTYDADGKVTPKEILKSDGTSYDPKQYEGDLSEITIESSGDTELVNGGLESSGTDLATEISNMIVIQRGYQANTRIVTVTDSMLEELVNMKR